MKTTRKQRFIAFAVAGSAAVALGGAAVATAGNDDAENEKPIPAAQSQRAADAALAAVPGKVTGTEVDDEEGAYEVEVTRVDGTEVDVHLDERFEVIGQDVEGKDEGTDGD